MTQEKALRMALEALRKARRKVLTTEECHAVIMSIKQVLAQPKPTKGNWINAEDVSRNVKALDIALNGEGAASSPLLIDVLGQVQAEARRIGKPVLKALAQPERTWVGLTADEFKFIASKYLLSREAGLEYFQEEIETKSKEKNT